MLSYLTGSIAAGSKIRHQKYKGKKELCRKTRQGDHTKSVQIKEEKKQYLYASD